MSRVVARCVQHPVVVVVMYETSQTLRRGVVVTGVVVTGVVVTGADRGGEIETG